MFMFSKRQQPHTAIIDRTSALTNNQLVVTSTWQPRGGANPVMKSIADSIIVSTDPLDRALSDHLASSGTSSPSQQPLHQLEFSQTTAVSGNIWHHGAQYAVAIKGMPEQVLDLCDLSDNERESITLQLQLLSTAGNYIVALASGLLKRDVKSINTLKRDEKLRFIALVSIAVTIPPSTRQLIDSLGSRGIHTYVMTGQHPAAGLHLGQQLGLVTSDNEVLDARHIDIMDDEAIFDALKRVSVIARADAQQKKYLTRLLLQLDKTAVSIDNLDALRHLANAK
ncbi:MAG: hypothetical protein ABIR91_02055 [Candidatus Saccharimonadales bacterium]